MAIENVLLTGAAGYLSGFIIPQLRHDYRLTLFDYLSLDSDLPFFQGDIRDLEAVVQACRGQGAVVHTVALVRGRSERSVSDFADIMVKGTWHLLEACAKQGVKQLINISSIAADGSFPPSPRSLLGNRGGLLKWNRRGWISPDGRKLVFHRRIRICAIFVILFRGDSRQLIALNLIEVPDPAGSSPLSCLFNRDFL